MDQRKVRFIFPKFKNGGATVRDIRVTPDYGYVEDIYSTFLEAVQDVNVLQDAAQNLRETSPLPMNTMLEKESKEAALERKSKRQEMTIKHVPPTTPLSEVLALEANAAKDAKKNKASNKKSLPHCTFCRKPMKGHTKVLDCPKNKK